MKKCDLKRINEAPVKGTRLIYTRKERFIFDDYMSLDGCINDIADQDLLEIHLFDNDKEYRAVTSESSRSENGVREWVSDFKEDASIYKETCLLEDGGKITVLNHVAYDDNNGMASIDDYRIKRG